MKHAAGRIETTLVCSTLQRNRAYHGAGHQPHFQFSDTPRADILLIVPGGPVLKEIFNDTLIG